MNEKGENICFTFIKLQKWVAILQGEKESNFKSIKKCDPQEHSKKAPKAIRFNIPII